MKISLNQALCKILGTPNELADDITKYEMEEC